MVAWTGMQSRDVPHPISATAGMRNANSSCFWGCGTAHEAVVVMTSAIISRESEVPLGYCGHGLDEWMSLFPERGMKLASQEAHRIIPIMAKPPANREGRLEVMDTHVAFNWTGENPPSRMIEGLRET